MHTTRLHTQETHSQQHTYSVLLETAVECGGVLQRLQQRLIAGAPPLVAIRAGHRRLHAGRQDVLGRLCEGDKHTRLEDKHKQSQSQSTSHTSWRSPIVLAATAVTSPAPSLAQGGGGAVGASPAGAAAMPLDAALVRLLRLRPVFAAGGDGARCCREQDGGVEVRGWVR